MSICSSSTIQLKALKASGATPEEIAKTMAASMEKSGASNEEIARVLAQVVNYLFTYTY